MDILHADVIRRILYFAVDNKNDDLDIWKDSLPLMAINREWRAIAAGRIYNRVLICCTTPGNNELVVETNIKLVDQNGFLGKTKCLFINDYTRESIAKVMPDIVEVFPAKFGIRDYISTISSIALREDSGDLVDDNQLFHACKAADDVAECISRYLPSVNHLGIFTEDPHPIYLSFVNKLVETFGSHLIDLTCTMPANLSCSLCADKLTTLQIHFHTKISYAIDKAIKPVFNPQHLNWIHITFDDELFTWDMFMRDSDSDVILFDSLTHLYLAGDKFLEYELRDGQFYPIAKVWPKIAFPHLTNLTIFGLPLTNDIVESIMSAPLKKLEYECQSVQAHALYYHRFSSLNELTLSFDMYIETSIDDFYKFTNAIFNRTHGISIVRCNIDDGDNIIVWSMVDWPHVTHLSINHLSELSDIIDAVPLMPNLVELLVVGVDTEDTDIPPLVAFLNSMKQTYLQPTSSKIRKLTISFLGLDESLDMALEELKWYLPKLEQIVKLC